MSERCAFCKNKFDKKYRMKTREHLYPQSIIKLFPEQDISFGINRTFKDNDGIVLKDVCHFCNNENLSELDTYGSNFIKDNFLNEFRILDLEETISVDFDVEKTSRWLLKIVYNFVRYLKQVTRWFDGKLGYILNNDNIDHEMFSIFVGFHVNCTPLPEETYEYKPLQLNFNPKLIGNSLAISTFGINPFLNSVDLKGTCGTYSIRLGSFISYVILWDYNVSDFQRAYGNGLMVNEFSFTKLNPKKNCSEFKRISAHSNSVMGYGHLISKSGIVQDDLFISESNLNRNPFDTQDLFRKERSEEDVAEARIMVEAQMFPDNRQVQKKLEEVLSRK